MCTPEEEDKKGPFKKRAKKGKCGRKSKKENERKEIKTKQ